MLQPGPDQEISSIPRRALLMAGFAGTVGSAFPRIARAATAIVLPAAAANRRSSVFYEGDKIGTHTISYSAETGETRVDTEISLLVKVAFFTLLRFTHRSTETWRAGRLMSLSSETLEHGETLRVEGAATPQGFRVVSKGGPFIAPAATLTSNSLWTPAVLEQATVVDAQHVWRCTLPSLPRPGYLISGRFHAEPTKGPAASEARMSVRAAGSFPPRRPRWRHRGN